VRKPGKRKGKPVKKKLCSHHELFKEKRKYGSLMHKADTRPHDYNPTGDFPSYAKEGVGKGKKEDGVEIAP